MDAKSKASFVNSVQDAAKPADTAPAFAAAAPAPKKGKYVEPTSVFAEGLPSWDLVPPNVMVRRH